MTDEEIIEESIRRTHASAQRSSHLWKAVYTWVLKILEQPTTLQEKIDALKASVPPEKVNEPTSLCIIRRAIEELERGEPCGNGI